MTADRNSSPAEAEMVAALGFERIAEGLEARGTQLRRMGGNLIMYGEGHAAADQNAAKALRSAASIIVDLLADLTAAPKATEAPGLRDASEDERDRLPQGHTVLEQADMMDSMGRVSQTVRIDATGEEYERIVHFEEAYGPEEDEDDQEPALSATPQPLPETPGLREALVSMVTDYLQPATYVRRFPADATKWATEFEMPHEHATAHGKQAAEKRRDMAFIADVIRLQETTPQPVANTSAEDGQ